MRKTPYVLIALTALFLAPVVNANSIRCGTHIIEDGGEHPPTMTEVIKKCGEPTSREWGQLIYRHHGKRLDFDSEGRLQVIHDIEDND